MIVEEAEKNGFNCAAFSASRRSEFNARIQRATSESPVFLFDCQKEDAKELQLQFQKGVCRSFRDWSGGVFGKNAILHAHNESVSPSLLNDYEFFLEIPF